MKKTEKIEIRVSPEDKAALMRLSEQGGRSVSETVRGLLLNQAAPGAAALPNAPPDASTKYLFFARSQTGAVTSRTCEVAARREHLCIVPISRRGAPASRTGEGDR